MRTGVTVALSLLVLTACGGTVDVAPAREVADGVVQEGKGFPALSEAVDEREGNRCDLGACPGVRWVWNSPQSGVTQSCGLAVEPPLSEWQVVPDFPSYEKSGGDQIAYRSLDGDFFLLLAAYDRGGACELDMTVRLH